MTYVTRSLITTQKRLISATGLCILLVLVTGCMGTPVVTSTPNSCATLIPQDWANGVPGPDLPSGDTVADWITFGDSAIGKLDQANGRQRDTMSIISSCEERDAKAVKEGSKGWLARVFS